MRSDADCDNGIVGGFLPVIRWLDLSLSDLLLAFNHDGWFRLQCEPAQLTMRNENASRFLGCHDFV